MMPAIYATCPHCQSPVNASSTARRGALQIIDAVLLAMSDSAINNATVALAAVAEALRKEEDADLAEHLWPAEDLARKAAIASQGGREE